MYQVQYYSKLFTLLRYKQEKEKLKDLIETMTVKFT